jgi:hypothetical protein
MIGKPLGKANRRQVRKIAKAVNKEGRRTAADFASMLEGQMSGGQAMVLVGGNKPSRGKRALRTGRRLVWRYRRQLAPVLGILITWLVGALIAGRPDATRSVLVLAPVAAALLWWAGRRWLHLDRFVEQLYAVAALLTASGWLAVAANGVDRPMPAILWLGGVMVAFPWWWHHRIRGVQMIANSTVTDIFNERVGASGYALPGAQLLNVASIKNGWEGLIKLPPGKLATQNAISATEMVMSAYDAEPGSLVIEPTASGRASEARLLVLSRNPLHDTLPWPGPATFDPATGISPIGIYADGEPALYRFYQPGSGAVHDLIAGAIGSGKSRVVDELLAIERASGLIVSWVIDPQRGQSLPDWMDNVPWSARDLEEGMRMLRSVHRVMLARNAYFATMPWIDDKGRQRRGKAHFDPTPEIPLLSVTIEEAHQLLRLEEARDLVEDITKMSRKCGVRMRLIVQVPLLDQLGGSTTIRDSLASGNVIVFRTANPLSGQVAFNGSIPVDPHRLPRTFPNGKPTGGMGYLLGASSRPAAMRTYYLDDAFQWATTGTPVELDNLSVMAAGPDYRTRGERKTAFDDFAAVVDTFNELTDPGAIAFVTGRTAEMGGDSDANASETGGGTAVDAVWRVLADRSGEMKKGEIAQAVARTSGHTMRSVTEALSRLVSENRVRQTGHGRYVINESEPREDEAA